MKIAFYLTLSKNLWFFPFCKLGGTISLHRDIIQGSTPTNGPVPQRVYSLYNLYTLNSFVHCPSVFHMSIQSPQHRQHHFPAMCSEREDTSPPSPQAPSLPYTSSFHLTEPGINTPSSNRSPKTKTSMFPFSDFIQNPGRPLAPESFPL